LPEHDAAFLEAYFQAHPAAREEMEALRRFVADMPTEKPQLNADLIPAVRARIEEQSGRLEKKPRLRPAAAIAALVFVAAGFFLLKLPDAAPPGHLADLQDGTAAPAASPLAAALSQTDKLLETGNYADAYKVLSAALGRSPDEPDAGDAQMTLAEIAFARLHWYEQAYDDYERLYQKYHQTWLNTPPHVRDRRDLLAEARLVQFRSLQDLDAARANKLDPLDALARVIATYPNQAYVRSQAALEMARRTIESGAVDPQSSDALLQALRHVRNEASDPLVVAQLSYQMGYLYESQYHEFDKAREAFLQASEHPALQQQARSALARLDAESIQ
jgi:tetratricopeptide (TPR) repeat protein